MNKHDFITETSIDENFGGTFLKFLETKSRIEIFWRSRQRKKKGEDLVEAKDRRREGRRGGAARFGGRRRGREGAERRDETLAVDISERDRDPAERQAMVVWFVVLEMKSQFTDVAAKLEE